MKMNNFSKAIIVVAIVGVVGFAATSFAGRGRGGGGNCWDQGPGWAQRGSGPAGYQGNLSDEDLGKLNKQRQAFFEDTRDLRGKIYQKQLELQSELAKKDPDAKKAAGLQGEISDLSGRMGQKRVDHRIMMQKENPDFFAGRGYGMRRGYGKGGGKMGRGYGMSQGYGMGGGYGKGMGRGFRGQGGGGMGRGFQGQGGGSWY